MKPAAQMTEVPEAFTNFTNAMRNADRLWGANRLDSSGIECQDGSRLPFSKVWRLFDPEEADSSGGHILEFRLIYKGPLPAEKCNSRGDSGAAGKAKAKHELRKVFHLQLRELWSQHPDLKAQASTPCHMSPSGGVPRFFFGSRPHPEGTIIKTYLDHIADNYTTCGGRFVPLISDAGGFTCSLDILFLRRDGPGGIIENGGDIDNRIKVLLDGLRMPNTVAEMGGYQIDQQDEDPFYCLLEDDRLITKVSVTTERLLTPKLMTEGIHDVELVIHVTMVNPSAVFVGDRII